MHKNSIEHLKKIGFELAGKWIKSSKKKDRIEFEIENNLEQSDLLYAFESNDIIYYIGKTDTTLKSRMDNYKAGKKDGTGGKTNKKVHEKIIKLLDTENEVNIYVLLTKIDCDFYGYKVSLASGIEMSLINHFDSDILWNSRGTGKTNSETKKSMIETKESVSNSNSEENISNSFVMKLGKEYYTKGIISFPARFKNILPAKSGIQVKIRMEDDKIIYGTYTISGETRKINGKEMLTKWFNKFTEGDKILVVIESTLIFHISKI